MRRALPLCSLLFAIGCAGPPALEAPDLAAAPTAGEVDGAGPADDGGGGPGTDEAGCGAARLLPRPPDPAQRGPWPVGARTVTIGRLTVELFYPAAPGSDAGRPPATYDIRQQLPASQRGKISDEKNPLQRCDCARDLPLDEARGPYPLVLFIHGTAAFRTQSLSSLTHLASRGFVVAAADHPGLMLKDSLALVCPGEAAGMRDLPGDARAVLAALSSPEGSLGFLAGRVDRGRLALVGHSAGGATVAALGETPGAQVVVPWSAGSAVKAGADLRAVLFLGGVDDKVVRFASVRTGYLGSPAPRRLVGVSRAGHLLPTDLCSLRNAAGEDLVTVARGAGVCGVGLAGLLFDCSDAYLDAARGREIVNAFTAATLERTLQCAERDIAGLRARYAEIGEYDER